MEKEKKLRPTQKKPNGWAHSNNRDFLQKMRQQVKFIDDQPGEQANEEEEKEELSKAQKESEWLLTSEQQKQLQRDIKKFKKMVEPQTLSEIEEMIQDVEDKLKEVNGKHFPSERDFYQTELEKLRKKAHQKRPKMSQEDKEKLNKKFRKQKRFYKNLKDLDEKSDIEETIEELRQLIETIPEQGDFEDFTEFFEEKKKIYEAKLAKLQIKKLTQAEIQCKWGVSVALVKEHSKKVKKYKRYKEMEEEEEIKQAIEDLEDDLADLPEGYQQFEQFREYYANELDKWKSKINAKQVVGLKASKKNYSPAQRLIKIKELKEQKKIFLKFREPSGKEETQERLEEYREALAQVPEGYEEFDEFIEFYKKGMDQLEHSLKQQGSKKGSKKGRHKKLDTDSDEEPKPVQVVQPKKKPIKMLPSDSDDEKQKQPKGKNPKKLEDTDEEVKQVSKKKPKRQIDDSDESDTQVKPKPRASKLLETDSEEDMKKKKPSKRTSGLKKGGRQNKFRDDSPSSSSDDLQKPKQQKKAFQDLTDDEKFAKKKKFKDSDNAPRAVQKKPGRKIEDSDEDIQVKPAGKKKQILKFDSEEDKQAPKKKYEEVKKKPKSFNIRLECGHEFKKEELMDQFKRRTNGLIYTIDSDPVGEKSFKCLRCYHLITPEEKIQIIGEKLSKELQVEASDRMMKMFDDQGNPKKVEKQVPRCGLCDSTGVLQANHDNHAFCKNCWNGVVSHYKTEVGCLQKDCIKFKLELNNTKIKDWLKGGGVQPQPNNRYEVEAGYVQQSVVKGKVMHCESCGAAFDKWKFQQCEEDCEIKLCKKCAANLYRQEKKDECLSCFEVIPPNEYEQFIQIN